MKRVALALLLSATVLTLALPARATSITGDMVLAGQVTFSTSGVTFLNNRTAIVLMANGTLSPLCASMMGSCTGTVTMDNITSFSTEAGRMLFQGSDGVTVEVVTDTKPMFVTSNGLRFLNWAGTALVTENGFTPTSYDFSFTATRTDGLSTFTLDASTVPEPGSLLLVGSGLVGFAGLIFWKAKKPVATLRC